MIRISTSRVACLLTAAGLAASSLSAQSLAAGSGDQPLAAAPSTGQPTFTDFTAASGVNFLHADNIATMAGGVCFVDYDDDGDADLFATNSGGLSNMLFQNQGNGTFVDATATAGLASQGVTNGAYSADLDNDGFQDLMVVMVSRLRIMKNNGDGTFTDVSNGSGIIATSWNMAATVGDYDNDGLLDIYVGTYIFDGFFPYYDGAPNHLFHNDGNFKFTDVTNAAGVDGYTTFLDPRGFTRSTYPCTLSTLFYDYDRDGWLDILVGNDLGPFVIPDQLFRNNRDGTFTEVAAGAGFKIAEFNMGLAAADVNGDLIPDIYTTNMGPNHLLLNDGRGRLNDVTTQWGASEGFGANGLPLTSWACFFFDMDLDGQRDLYVSNGYVKVTNPPMPNELLAPSRPLQNIGRAFQIVNEPAFPWDRRVGRGAACADIDGDGDEDIAQLNNKDLMGIYRNETVTNNHRFQFDLVGTLSNRDAIGAYVVARSKQLAQAIDNVRGGSYASCNAGSIILGLGDDSRVNEVEITWPSGTVSSMLALDADIRHEIVEPTVTIKSVGSPRPLGPFIEIPVTIENHATTSQPVTFSFGLAWRELRGYGTAYHFPVALGAGATSTVMVYLPFDSAAIPLAQSLGVWWQINAHSGAMGGQDQVERPF